MSYVWATGTHQGLVRDGNEDAVHPVGSGSGPGPTVVAVADGMGGHVAGEVASRLAIEGATAAEADAPEDRATAANRAILEQAAVEPALRGMGTTLTLGIFGEDGILRMAHVGDSRAYLMRDGELQILTEDHTVVAELVAMGHLSEEAAEEHPQRHLLTRTLGLGPVEVDTFEITLAAGDRVLLCSDGLTTMLGDDEIETILSAENGVEAAVWSLIEAANSSGGIDNTTVAVVDVKR